MIGYYLWLRFLNIFLTWSLKLQEENPIMQCFYNNQDIIQKYNLETLLLYIIKNATAVP